MAKLLNHVVMSTKICHTVDLLNKLDYFKRMCARKNYSKMKKKHMCGHAQNSNYKVCKLISQGYEIWTL